MCKANGTSTSNVLSGNTHIFSSSYVVSRRESSTANLKCPNFNAVHGAAVVSYLPKPFRVSTLTMLKSYSGFHVH
jgi:hypothetical protein